MMLALQLLVLAVKVRSALPQNSSVSLEDVAINITNLRGQSLNRILRNLNVGLFIQRSPLPETSTESTMDPTDTMTESPATTGILDTTATSTDSMTTTPLDSMTTAPLDTSSMDPTTTTSTVDPGVQLQELAFLANINTAPIEDTVAQLLNLSTSINGSALIVAMNGSFFLNPDVGAVVPSGTSVSLPSLIDPITLQDTISQIINTGTAVITNTPLGVDLSVGIVLRMASRRVYTPITKPIKPVAVTNKRPLTNAARLLYKQVAAPRVTCPVDEMTDTSMFSPLSNLMFYERKDFVSDTTSLIIKIVKNANLPPIGETLYLMIKGGPSEDIMLPLISLVTFFGANAADVTAEVVNDSLVLAIPIVENTPDLIIAINNLGIVNTGVYNLDEMLTLTATLGSDIISNNPFITTFPNYCDTAPANFSVMSNQEAALLNIYRILQHSVTHNFVSAKDISKMAISAFINELKSNITPCNKKPMGEHCFNDFCSSFTSCVAAIAACEEKPDCNYKVPERENCKENYPEYYPNCPKVPDLSCFRPNCSEININLLIEISMLFGEFVPECDFTPISSKPLEGMMIEPTHQISMPIKQKAAPATVTKKPAQKKKVDKEQEGSISSGYYVAGGAIVAFIAISVYAFVF